MLSVLKIYEDCIGFYITFFEHAISDFLFGERSIFFEHLANDIADDAGRVPPIVKRIESAANKHKTRILDKFVMARCCVRRFSECFQWIVRLR